MHIIHSGLEDTTNYASSNHFLKINSCGTTMRLNRTDSAFSVRRPKGRKDYQLLYIITGQAEHFLNGEWKMVEAGQAVLYLPGDIQYYTYSAKSPITCKWIHFTGSGAKEILEQTGLSSAAPVLNIGESREIVSLFDRILQETQQMPPCHEPLSQALLYELLSLLGRQMYIRQDLNGYQTRQKIMQIAEYMHTHLAQPLSLEDYAVQCGMSKYHFAHLFRAAMGQSPHAYLTALRMEHARLLLETTEMPIGHIAQECGYENPLYFSRLYSQRFLLSPQAYRKKYLASLEGIQS
ncbi:MAG: helix-turn-helix domain-containing protein [Clostridiales bacterium]|nr:helix-turn-helix domain-containing protein [Clostridiales bacterium]